MTTIDLNARRAARAARREAGGGPVTVPFGDAIYELPAELPAAVLMPLLDGDLDLAWLMKGAFDAYRGAKPSEQDKMADLVVEGLITNPTLPVDVLRAIRSGLEELFGAEQWSRFWNSIPSLPDIVELIKGCWEVYGVSLGEAFASSASSSSGGATSNPTSNGSTSSMPAVAGLAPLTPSS
jgi:hypothetical protein